MIYENWDGTIIQIAHAGKDKVPVLCVGWENHLAKVAVFDSEAAAQEFAKIFEKFVTITKEGNANDE